MVQYLHNSNNTLGKFYESLLVLWEWREVLLKTPIFLMIKGMSVFFVTTIYIVSCVINNFNESSPLAIALSINYDAR